jgi:hypothetical protein
MVTGLIVLYKCKKLNIDQFPKVTNSTDFNSCFIRSLQSQIIVWLIEPIAIFREILCIPLAMVCHTASFSTVAYILDPRI